MINAIQYGVAFFSVEAGLLLVEDSHVEVSEFRQADPNPN